MSFFQKIRAVTLGAAHDLLNKAVDMNSPSVLRQYVRDLETAIEQMQSEAAIQSGQVRTMTRERAELEAKVSIDKSTITNLLQSPAASAKAIATTKASLVLQSEKRLVEMTPAIASQQAVADQIDAAVAKLSARHDDMLERVRELEQLDRDTKAKESASSAIRAAGAVLSGSDSTSVDDLEGRMRRRNDVASASFDQSMAHLPADSGADNGEVEALLASLAPQPALK